MYHSASFTPIKFIKLINLERTVVLIVQQNYPINPLENISQFAHVRYLCLDMIR